jgi:Tfp pilus assembly protein PilV
MPRSAGVASRAAGGRRGEAGFLYVEVLIGFAILAVVLLAAIPLFVMAMRVSSASSDLTLEANFVRDKAEWLQSQSLSAITAGSDTFRIESRLYRRTWTVENDVPFQRMKTITITAEPVQHLNFGQARVFTLSVIRAY